MKLEKFVRKEGKKYTGHLDKVEGLIIYGWAYNKENPEERVEVVVLVDGKPVAEGVADQYREDLKQAGIGDGKHAFVIKIPDEYVDGKEHVVEVVVKNYSYIKLGSLHLRLIKAGLYIDSIKDFEVHGWAFVNDRTSVNLCLEVGENKIDLKPIWVEREDVAKAYGLPYSKVGFIFHIPGVVWKFSLNDDVVKITLSAGDVIRKEFTITKEEVISWCRNILTVQDSMRKQYLSLCALEHIKYGKLMEKLDEKTRQYFQEFIEVMNLYDFLEEDEESDISIRAFNGITIKEKYTKDLYNQIFKDLYWKLNEKLIKEHKEKPISNILQEFLIEYNIQGKLLHDIIVSAIPFLAKHNELDSLLNFSVNLGEFVKRKDADNLWDLGLAVCILFYLKQYDEAKNVLYKIANNIDKGWLPTECILYVVRNSVELFKKGLLNFEILKEIVYGYLEIIKRMSSDYWHSRVYNTNLLNSAIEIFKVLFAFHDWLYRDFVYTILKIYGLNPIFWESIEEFIEDNDVLREAYLHFESIKNLIENPGLSLDEGHFKAFRYFKDIGNIEVDQYVREILLEKLNQGKYEESHKLYSSFINNNEELIRIASHPFITDEILEKYYKEETYKIESSIRNLWTHIPKSEYYQFIKKLGLLIKELSENNFNRNLIEKVKSFINALHQLPLNQLDYLSFLLLKAEEYEELEKIFFKLLSIKREVLKDSPLTLAIINRLIKANVISYETLKLFLNSIYLEDANDYFGLFGNHVLKSNNSWGGDTLIVIYSCKKNLSSNIEAIRKTWLKDVQKYNIPYLIITGDGDDSINGDVLSLNVSDDYEHLPLKTLKLIEWVYKNTDFIYMYKIDDDCYLDVEKFIFRPFYRRHHYYGRILYRNLGQSNRMWHKNKSKGISKYILDKSPEPCIYTDGGSGWSISRFAMKKILDSLETEYGQWLLSVCFMEDKIVGDLLNFAGIKPSQEEYYVLVRRKTHREATPVNIWSNIFYSSQTSPTVVNHLDDLNYQKLAEEYKSKISLNPKKIYPTFTVPQLDYKSNQLELLSDLEKLKTLREFEPIVVSRVRNEMIILPHFLNHYRKLGVKSFFIVDNLSDDGTREYLLSQEDVVLFSTDTNYRDAHQGIDWQQAILGNFLLGKWVLLVDADEFIVYENCEEIPIIDFIKNLEREGFDCVRTDLIDMYPKGHLEEADFTIHAPFEVANYFDKKPIYLIFLGSSYYSNHTGSVSALRHRIISEVPPHYFTASKYTLFKYYPWIRFISGIHDITGFKKLAVGKAWLAHFKYHKAFKSKVINEVKRKQYFNNAEEYRKYLQALQEGITQFWDEAISMEYNNSKSFCELMREYYDEI